MSETAAAGIETQADEKTAPVPSTGRWGLAVLAASAVAIPIGWLLCYAALLPFYLGLFFFLLFGLLLGAVAYRVAAPVRPLSRRRIGLGTAVIVLAAMLVSVAVEAYDFPSQMADHAIHQHRRLPKGTTPLQFREEAEQDVKRHLRENFAPGGMVGYIRWAATNGRIDSGVGHLRRPYRASQPRGWWIFRVAASIGFLAFGIYSQFGALRRRPTPADRGGTGVNPLSKM